ncbi:PREDICTED: uncharacterized protein LOC108557585 [Nicrophorus vespilloides]|uniref:Uncharacterized protein LOC108557585 n=1 Tax=Nicrophorus vespilloides TaxID=110193 RepID=A0ABM1M510_NICVS|nr:PREDICTED: uncharacterized protein LOC108557585 [Nicrophorus vespilloides]
MATIQVEELQELISNKFDKETLLGILRKRHDLQNVEIEKIQLGSESKKGDSYLSTVTRFNVHYNGTNKDGKKVTDCIHMIAKALPKNLGRRKTFRSADFFGNEVSFYNKVWPVLDAYQKSKNVEKPFDKIPICFSAFADGSNDYIVLEDLSFDGYGNAQRSSGLDVDHTKQIFSLFAQFHSLVYAYKQEHPSEFEKLANSLQETYFSEAQRKWYTNFQNILKDIVRDAVEKELPKEYLDKLNEVAFNRDFFGLISEVCAKRGKLSVITHGDAWIPNFLLKYDQSGKPIDAVMIDFQLTRCSSLALDLLFFIYSCMQHKLVENSLTEMLEYYLSCFHQNLRELKCSATITITDIETDLKDSSIFGLGMSMEAIIMSLLDDDEVSDLDMIQGDEEIPIENIWIVKPLKTVEKRRRIADFVKHIIDSKFI